MYRWEKIQRDKLNAMSKDELIELIMKEDLETNFLDYMLDNEEEDMDEEIE